MSVAGKTFVFRIFFVIFGSKYQSVIYGWKANKIWNSKVVKKVGFFLQKQASLSNQVLLIIIFMGFYLNTQVRYTISLEKICIFIT